MRNSTTYAVQTNNLAKRYGAFWALQDCTIDVPKGSVTALVGANGAGKSTLLKTLTGLSKLSAGSVTVLGERPGQSTQFLRNVGYLAQDIPLYKQLTAQDHLAIGAHLNTDWDENLMEARLRDLSIPFDRPVGTLSGGQRAQVALAMALAKKPQLLLLDEPVAALDPLARRDFLGSLAQAVAATGITVVMSSHLLADLELICDRVIIMAGGRVQLSDDIEHALQTHKLLVGPRQDTAAHDAPYTVIQATHTPRQSTLLVQFAEGQKMAAGHNWQVHDVSIEDIVLAYMGRIETAIPATKLGGTQ